MSVISIAIQKGGSGKTTTTLNLGAALHHQGKKILLVDADPQGSLTQALGFAEEPEENLYTELKKAIAGEDGNIEKAITVTNCGLHLLPASTELASAELELVSVYGREKVFTWMLEPVLNKFDFIFIDCPPAIGMLTVNALTCSNYVLFPLQAEFLPLKGLQSFTRSVKMIKKQLNSSLEIIGYVLTKFDGRKSMTQSVLNQLEVMVGDGVFTTRIRTNIALAQAQEKGMDIFSYDKGCHGAQDYHQLSKEFLEKIKHHPVIEL